MSGLFGGGSSITNEGPRLSTLELQKATFGTPIKRLYGTYRVTGNVIWALPLKETIHETVEDDGGKGGGGTETTTRWYSYQGTWAMGLVEGPITDILKIWFDAILVYDGIKYLEELNESNNTVYLGTGDQEVNWIIQADQQDTPAFRNLCYIVFDNIELERYGNRIPSVSVELSNSATISYGSVWDTENTLEIFNPQPIDNIIKAYEKTATQLDIYDISVYGEDVLKIKTVNTTKSSNLANIFNNAGTYSSGGNIVDNYEELYTEDNKKYIKYIGASTLIDQPGLADYIQIYDKEAFAYYSSITGNVNTTTITEMFRYNDNQTILSEGFILSDILVQDNKYQEMCIGDNELYTFDTTSTNIDVYSLKGIYLRSISHDLFTFPHTPSTPNTNSYLRYGGDGFIYVIVWTIDNKPTIYKLNDSVQEVIGIVETALTVSPTDQVGYVVYEGQFIVNGTTISIINNATVPVPITLTTILEDIIQETNLEEDDYYIEEVLDTVVGFIIHQPATTRNVIEPLLDILSYRFIEDNYILQLIKEGESILVSIPEIDLLDGFKIIRKQELDLSESIVIEYTNSDRSYENSTQFIRRIDSSATKTKKIQYPVAMTDDKAKQLIEIKLYKEWTAIDSFEFSLTNKYLYLKASDIIKVTDNGFTYIVKLTKVTYTSNNEVHCEGHLDDLSIHISNAVGASTPLYNDVITLQEPTYFYILDIPMLDNYLDSEGLYFAAHGMTSGWTGCSIYKNTNSLNPYNNIFSINSTSIVGYTTTILQEGVTHLLDDINTVTIYTNIGALYSITYNSLLNANNYILIGNEVLQYQTVIDNGDNTFTLSKLFRGRRGTEWAIGTHNVGEIFVFLTNNLGFDSTASIDIDYKYKAITQGSSTFSEVQNTSNSGVCTRPLSPSYVKGTKDISNNITISWHRRSRDVTGYFKTLQLLEETELYEVDIINTDRILYTTTQSVIYTIEDQTEDGFSLGDPITIEVFQINSKNTRGYGTQEII